MHQDIVQFQIPMHDSDFVERLTTLNKLVHDLLGNGLSEPATVHLEQISQGASICELLNQIEVALCPHEFNELDDVRGVDDFKEERLSRHSLHSTPPVVGEPFHFREHPIIRGGLRRVQQVFSLKLVHDTLGAFAQLRPKIVIVSELFAD